MFTCNGTLNSITIPYSTIQGTRWDDVLDLTLSVLRRLNRGGYITERISLGRLTEVITNSDETTDMVQGNATLNTISSNMILEFDIIQITVPGYDGDKREHIPVLLTEHQLGDGGRTVLLPLIQVDFTPEGISGKDIMMSFNIIISLVLIVQILLLGLCGGSFMNRP